MGAILRALEGVTLVNFPFIPEYDLLGALRNLQLVEDERERFLNLAELANARRLHTLLTPTPPATAVPFPPIPGPAPLTAEPKGGTGAAKRPKLSSLVDVTAEAELQKLPASVIQ
jgi:hypothetical protein